MLVAAPPFKRGRGRPPASARAAAPPTLLTEGVPKEEHDEDEERYDAVVASPTRTRRNAAAAPPVFHEQPILDAQDDGQEQIINHAIDDHMQVRRKDTLHFYVYIYACSQGEARVQMKKNMMN